MSLIPASRIEYYRGSVIETQPAVEPVTLAEVKALLVIADTADDALITAMIPEARAYIEHMAGMALITQGWRLSLDSWPVGGVPWWDGVRQSAISELAGTPRALELPVWPLQTVDAVTVYDEAGTASTVTVATTFDVDAYQHPGRLALRNSATWPIALRATNAIQIEYTAGYGDTAADVPAPLKRAVKQMVAYMYAHRGDGCDAGDAYTESGAAAAIGRYKVVKI